MSSTSTTKQESSPPEWSKAGYQQLGSEVQRLYNSGQGGNVYEGSTVAPLSAATTSGIEQMYNAGQNWDTSGTRGLFAGTGALALDNPYLSENAYLQQALNPALDETAARIRSTYSGMGRGNSDVEQKVLARELGNLQVSALANDWDRRGQLLSQGIGQAQQAATSMAGLDQQNFQNQLTGANAALQAGGLIDAQNQRDLEDYVGLWTALDNKDWGRAGMYSQALAGASADYGTQTSRTKSSNPAAVLGALGSMPKKAA